MAKTTTNPERPEGYEAVKKEKMPDYYAILGVERSATPPTVKKAYYALMKKYHSDKTGIKEELYDELASPVKLNEAYEVLSDEGKRKDYDKKYYTSLDLAQRMRHDRFYGVRKYRLGDMLPQAKYLLTTTAKFEQAPAAQKKEVQEVLEEASILDSIEWDNLEIELGGEYDAQAQQILEQKYHEAWGKGLKETPWYRLCSKGYQCYLEGDFQQASNFFTQLCKRIPKNIIYMYRLALCLEELRKHDEAVKLYKTAINTAAQRPDKQACIVIRKTLGDLYLKMGKQEEAMKIWQGVQKMKRRSGEARDVLAAMQRSNQPVGLLTTFKRLALPWSK
ncbi:MAG: tetratricopeptide repeat protein [Planctomycetes bacterium]|nr:tetratricopeptide repeat protein [Planctomycetota bacterium]